jgi:hypothetical protein
MKYKGVSYHHRDKRFAPRIWFNNKWVWLRTFRKAEDAAKVRDYADRWLHAGNARLNFKDRSLPLGVTEADVAGWMIEGGIPMKMLVHRIPLHILVSAGIMEHELVMAGVPLTTALDVCSAAVQNIPTVASTPLSI